MDFKRIYETNESKTLYDILIDQTKFFYFFISEEGGKYSGSYEEDMYYRHYGIRMPLGAEYFQYGSGYLKGFKPIDIEISAKAKEEFKDVLSLPVKTICNDPLSYCVNTQDKEQTDRVKYVLNAISPRNYNDDPKLTIDVVEDFYKYGHLDDAVYDSYRHDVSVFDKFIPMIEEREFCPRCLLQLAESIKGFDWPDPSKVVIAYLKMNWDRPNASIEVALVDNSIDKHSTNEDEYLKKLQDHFGETQAEFKNYYNSYTGNCPNPFNYSFDHNARMVIHIKIQLPEEK